MKKLLFSILFSLGIHFGYSQVYKAEAVFVKENDEFRYITNVAYLDYNLKPGKYVELMFYDSIYHYKVKPTGRPINKERFIVYFKETTDNMLWNLLEEGNYIFAFEIGPETYWFKDLKNVTREEYDKYKTEIQKTE